MIMENHVAHRDGCEAAYETEDFIDGDQEATPQSAPEKRHFKRMHQHSCGFARVEYDSYEDVKLACERKIAEWERMGLLIPWRSSNGNDWLFGGNP